MPVGPGSRLDAYEIVGPLGTGGMGEVWLAHDTSLGRKVALKVLPAGLTSDQLRVARFEQEARAASALSHPNVCHIYALGHTADGQVYIAMELVEGETLRAHLRHAAVTIDSALNVAIQVATALSAAHAAGIVHRDVKPENVMLRPDGLVKVLDFGLAKLTASADSAAAESVQTALRTDAGTVVGTVAYMSPEQARGQQVDARTDIWSLAVVLYEMVAGRSPFEGQSRTDVLAAILDRDPAPIARFAPEVPPELQRIVTKALRKDRVQRYQTMQDLLLDLKALSDAPGVPAREPAAERSTPWWKGRVAFAAVALVALAVTVAAGWRLVRVPDAGGTQPTQTAIAVLPFQNLSADRETDFMRFGLADEVSGILSPVASLAVRPSSMTRRYAASEFDPQAAGRELRVAKLVTGHFLREADRLRITVEAIDVESARVLWRDVVSVQADNVIAMQAQIAGRVQQSLLPLLGVSPPAHEASTRPTNAEAYDLYLRSAAVPFDAAPNKQAIAMLERSVGLDRAYARAWAALGLRYSYDVQYSDGGLAAFERSVSAYERAMALDPTLIGDAAAPLILRRVEKGELDAAYETAAALVQRHPGNSRAQFALGYVFRYVGLLDDAAARCEAARDRDPTDRRLRSCGIAFLRLGRYARARDFLRLDAGSEFAAAYEAEIFLSEGNLQASLGALRRLPDGYAIGAERLGRACLEHRSPSEIAGLARTMQLAAEGHSDLEPLYDAAVYLALCGRADEAIHALQQAIRGGYCSYPALISDPLLAPVKGHREFGAVVSAAKACRERFEAYRRDHGGT